MYPEQKRYWYRIGFGALLVFAIGMTGITVVRMAIGEARTVARTAGSLRLPLALVPFRVDSARLGTMEGLELDRSEPGKVKAVRLSVRLGDTGAARALGDCLLTLPDPGRADHGADFHCVKAADTLAARLSRFGEVRLEPVGRVLPLLIPADKAAEWRTHASVVDSALASVRLQADSTGAVLDVRGRNGGKRVRIAADVQGARVSILGSPGDSAAGTGADTAARSAR